MVEALTQFGIISIVGKQAGEFLQGQLTCDVYQPGPTLAAYCNQKGRVVASMYLVAHEDTFYCILPASMIDLTLNTLSKYAVFSKVVISDVSDHWFIYGATNNHPPADLIIDVPNSPNRQLVLNKTALDSEPATNWDTMDIKAGVAWITPRTSEKFTPHMLNYPALGAVSFTKGCYLGQEIVARTEHLGKVKRHLEIVDRLDAKDYQPGDAIELDDKIGTVINASSSLLILVK